MKKAIKLLDYQKEHADTIMESIINHSRALDASDTGTGKTYVSIYVCQQLNLIPFIICPKSVKNTWTTILGGLGYKPNEYWVTNYESLYTKKSIVGFDQETKKFTWNFDSFPEIKKHKSRILFIYDEAHRCKNIDSNNCQIAIALQEHRVKILLLSATLADKIEFFLPFGLILGFYKDLGSGLIWMSNLNNSPVLINKKIFNEYGSRMKKSDTQNIFSNNKIYFNSIFIENQFEIEQKYDRIYKLMEFAKKIKKEKPAPTNKKKEKKENKEDGEEGEEGIKIEVGDKDEDDVDIANIKATDILVADDDGNLEIENGLEDEDNKLTPRQQYRVEIMSLRQEIELLKVNTMANMATEHIKKNKSVVIFVNFTKTIIKLKERLNTDCVIWGLQDIEARNKSIDDFCSDKSRVIICNIKAGSEGISLHDTIGKYPRVSIISPTWSAQDLLQALGRIHRAMGKTDCVQEVIYCKNTVEEHMGQTIKNKINNIRLVNDGKITVKNDNLETLLKNSHAQKMKVEQKKMRMYETRDFDRIQDTIDSIEREIIYTKKNLNREKPNSLDYNKLKYRLEELNREMVFNVNNLKVLTENVGVDDY
jgi:superfamily II DNA or RNA helicase